MEKLKLHSPNLTEANITRIAELFPSCVVEAKDYKTGELRRSIDFDQLRQELSDHMVEGPQERYRLDWPGKREALLAANAPIAKTLRPTREESVDFDTTKNLFLEGDNLDGLKLLQETYLGKVKVAYIDPPYNTGKDFIYEDDFAENVASYKLRSNQEDSEGGKLISNPDSNGRFHSDWLNMLYSRLKLARNLLSEDGVIFINIDDSESANVRKICDEIFGEDNFLNQIVHENDSRARPYGSVATTHEYIYVYSKSNEFVYEELINSKKEFRHQDDDGGFDLYELRNRNIAFNIHNRPNLYYPFWLNPNNEDENGLFEISLTKHEGWVEVLPQESQGVKTVWRWGKDKAKSNVNEILFGKATTSDSGYQIVKKYREKTYTLNSVWNEKSVKTDRGTLETKALFQNKKLFDFPKPVELLKRILAIGSSKNSLVLDFFAGSSTTAHAVMQLNAEDGGNRRFIMVQLPEACDEKSEAFKAGYKTIAEISKERIRRAGKKIKEDNATTAANLDTGFRVLKVDTSNAKDIYYTPDQIKQDELALHVDHIKEDRTAEDLLFQVMLDWGVDLSLPITAETIQGKQVSFVDENAIAACFESGINEDFVKELAKRQPLRAVFRDASYESDALKINIGEIFKLLSPTTELKTI